MARGRSSSAWVLAGLGAGLVGVVAIRATRGPQPAPAPPAEGLPLIPYDRDDLEAAARMLASENPDGSIELHTEQLYVVLRNALKRRVSIYQQITNGHGYGDQNERRGEARPYSTAQEATTALRTEAERILKGAFPTKFPGAMRWFEPATQDRSAARGRAAREKLARGEKLTKAETKALEYKSDATDLRRRWGEEGHRTLGAIEGVEFLT